MNAVATIAVNSDTSTLLNALSKTFSRTTTVIGELLQNGRRAGATQIDVLLVDGNLTVIDNGCGIDDFSVLLSIAKSGWNQEIQRIDSPYGIGFTATIFACERISVTSRGLGFSADTADLIALHPVSVQKVASDSGKTEIRLQGQRIGNEQQVMDAVRNLARGFSVPITLNGEMLDRPCALDVRDFVPTPVGMVTTNVLTGDGVAQYYLQGLPINVPLRSIVFTGRYNPDKGVVHLDSTLFEGRMPDRDALLNPEASVKVIEEGLKQAAIAHLTALASTMDESSFVKAYGWLAARLEMKELLNAMDCIPKSWVSAHRGSPILCGSNSSETYLDATLPDVITREMLKQKGLYSICTEDEHAENMIAAHAACEVDGYIACHSIPSWHWAAEMIETLAVEDFTAVPGVLIGSESLDLHYETVTLRLVESLHITLNDPSKMGGRSEPIPTAVLYDPHSSTLYATAEASSYVAVLQVSDFEEDERYQQDACETAQSNFDAMVAVLRDKDPAVLLATFLKAGLPWKLPAVLRGHAFSVSFDDNGEMKVALPEAA